MFWWCYGFSLPDAFDIPCPCCRSSIGNVRRIFVDQEICTEGVKYEAMKKQLVEYEKKTAEQNTMINDQTIKINQLTDTCMKLKDNCSEKETEWREKIQLLERENHELRVKSALPSKLVEIKAPAQDLSALKAFFEQNMQRAESKWKEKISELEKKLCESDYKLRQKVKLQKEFEIELRKKLETEIREELNKESQSADEDPQRRKMPFRECRKRVRTYKE